MKRRDFLRNASAAGAAITLGRPAASMSDVADIIPLDRAPAPTKKNQPSTGVTQAVDVTARPRLFMNGAEVYGVTSIGTDTPPERDWRWDEYLLAQPDPVRASLRASSLNVQAVVGEGNWDQIDAAFASARPQPFRLEMDDWWLEFDAVITDTKVTSTIDGLMLLDASMEVVGPVESSF